MRALQARVERSAWETTCSRPRVTNRTPQSAQTRGRIARSLPRWYKVASNWSLIAAHGSFSLPAAGRGAVALSARALLPLAPAEEPSPPSPRGKCNDLRTGDRGRAGRRPACRNGRSGIRLGARMGLDAAHFGEHGGPGGYRLRADGSFVLLLA